MPTMTLLPGRRQLGAVDNLRQNLTTVRAPKDFATLRKTCLPEPKRRGDSSAARQVRRGERPRPRHAYCPV
jgi:hypothetical protein